MTVSELIETIRADALIIHRNGAKRKTVPYCLLRFKGFRAVFLFRICNFFYRKKYRLLFLASWIPWRIYSTIHNFEIPFRLQVGKGLLIWHSNGIVINDFVSIGDNCELFHQVTLGNWKGGQPTIGNNVKIYAGAKVFGKIRVGDNVTIGANSVVSKDVPSNCVVAGVPGRILYVVGDQRS